MKKKILYGVLFLFLAIQFIRPERNLGLAATPRDIRQVVTVPDSLHHLLQASCYDCHSNKTVYPWYSEVNPLGLWLNHHVEEGKAELNFSEFASYDARKKDHKLEEIAEQVKEGHMPLPSYTWIHTDVALNTRQVQEVVQWVKQARRELGVPPAQK